MGQAVVKMNAGSVCSSNAEVFTVMHGVMNVILICTPAFCFKGVVA